MNKYASIYITSFNHTQKIANAYDGYVIPSPGRTGLALGTIGAGAGALIGGGIGALTGESEDPKTGKKGTRLRNGLIGAGIGGGIVGAGGYLAGRHLANKAMGDATRGLDEVIQEKQQGYWNNPDRAANPQNYVYKDYERLQQDMISDRWNGESDLSLSEITRPPRPYTHHAGALAKQVGKSVSDEDTDRFFNGLMDQQNKTIDEGLVSPEMIRQLRAKPTQLQLAAPTLGNKKDDVLLELLDMEKRSLTEDVTGVTSKDQEQLLEQQNRLSHAISGN
jgi:hypothetical protein